MAFQNQNILEPSEHSRQQSSPVAMNQTAEQMTGPSSQHLAQLGESLTGTGAEAWQAYRNLSEQTSALPGIGKSVADAVARLRADTSLPYEHRRDVGNEKRAAAETVIAKLAEGAHGAATRLEAALKAGLMPQPHKDPGQRVLHRQELTTALGNKQGVSLYDAALKHLGENPHHDAELLGDFGKALFQAQGSNGEWAGLHAQAVLKYGQASGGTERQIAARRALQILGAGNLQGAVHAHRIAAETHLRRDDR